MSARYAAYLATGLSILSVLLCLIFVPVLWTNGAGIESDLRQHIDEFRVLESEVWTEVISARRQVGSHSRKARQAPRCGKPIVHQDEFITDH